MIPVVDQDKCDGCESCVDACPADSITIVEKGSQAKQIAGYAESHATDLIVTSRKGLGRTPHGFGCVTGRLLQDAHFPVMVR